VADALAQRSTTEVEVHAAAGSLTGSTNVEVLVLGVAVELVMAPSEIVVACDVGNSDLAEIRRSSHGSHCHCVGHLVPVHSPNPDHS
jgi:hypothetical protein